ncbi:MAG: hypothetical protein ACLUUO_16020 [Sellimonas intestinalis]
MITLRMDAVFAGRRYHETCWAARSVISDHVAKGMIKVGDTVTLTVDEENRELLSARTTVRPICFRKRCVPYLEAM